MSFGITELIIVLVIVLLLFGTSKLKSLGSDLGSAIKGFRTAVDNEDEDEVKSVTDSSDENSHKRQKTEQSESKS
ncbi:MAG: twin-arginine translocase TatA/TatE family subunit [Proteobacteria bacterium]|nr:twin-arginine translocase TatA/TatE family subunit [Pseudomonadota bacterium]